MVNDESSMKYTIPLSSIDHCMPLAYIRVCLGFRTLDAASLEKGLLGLKDFVRKTVNAQPFLAGHVGLSKSQGQHQRQIEVHFTGHDFVHFTLCHIKRLTLVDDEVASYVQWYEEGLPPSKLRPEQIATLPADFGDNDRMPVFRVQANIVEGGLIISIYLHHCISDGHGLGLLVSGGALPSAGSSRLTCHELPEHLLNEYLTAFASKECKDRVKLSWYSHDQRQTRQLKAGSLEFSKPCSVLPGRGCIFHLSRQRILAALTLSQKYVSDVRLTIQNIMMALIWRHMTWSRDSLILQDCLTSKLSIPVDVRQKLTERLSETYLGAAIDFVIVELDVETLLNRDEQSFATMARSIRKACDEIDETYVRQAIALAQHDDPVVDTRDLQSSNINRATGADMYITSWLKIPLYSSDLGMDLGKPDFVRKPWSRDPGSCVILPRKEYEAPTYEILIQMTKEDMNRLLHDSLFMSFVTKVID